MDFDYSTYLSPFTTRYGTPQMRQIWSEEHRRLSWRRVWVALAQAQYKQGLLTKKELDDITSHQTDIAIESAKQKEKEVYHELMSEIQTYAQQCTIGGGKIHLGATSADILDNGLILQTHEALTLLEKNLKDLLSLFAVKMKEHKDTVCMGYTHLQPAEPTTLGYRFAFYAQDLLLDLQVLQKIRPFITGKGIKGAVGTSASYKELLGEDAAVSQLEQDVMKQLSIEAIQISHQTYPRKIDLLVIESLSHIAASLHKFCFDYRVMQSPLFGEWMEKRDPKRVGSSAMPFKRNPDKAEKVCSLCRYVSSFVPLAWSNPANSLLERTLDDSAAQRIFMPEAFLAIDECVKTVKDLLINLEINTSQIAHNLSKFGQFAATEPLLMELVKKGANRQEMHELIKSCSMKAWQGSGPSLFDLLSENPTILSYLSKKEIMKFSNPSSHIGLAKKRTTTFLAILNKTLAKK